MTKSGLVRRVASVARISSVCAVTVTRFAAVQRAAKKTTVVALVLVVSMAAAATLVAMGPCSEVLLLSTLFTAFCGTFLTTKLKHYLYQFSSIIN